MVFHSPSSISAGTGPTIGATIRNASKRGLDRIARRFTRNTTKQITKAEVTIIFHGTGEKYVEQLTHGGISTEVGSSWPVNRFDQGFYGAEDIYTAAIEARGPECIIEYSADFSGTRILDLTTKPAFFTRNKRSTYIMSKIGRNFYDGVKFNSVRTGRVKYVFYNNKKVNSVFKPIGVHRDFNPDKLNAIGAVQLVKPQ